MNISKLYESKTQEVDMPVSQRNVEITFGGNDAYDKVLGINVTVVKKDTNIPYEGSALLVSIREKGGRSLIAPMPYNLLKHSDQVKFSERFIEIDDLKGHGLDTVVFVDASKISEAIIVYATLVYSRNPIRK